MKRIQFLELGEKPLAVGIRAAQEFLQDQERAVGPVVFSQALVFSRRLVESVLGFVEALFAPVCHSQFIRKRINSFPETRMQIVSLTLQLESANYYYTLINSSFKLSTTNIATANLQLTCNYYRLQPKVWLGYDSL